MELLQTLSPSASHCIKCFCNFIRILCLCRCQSAVKLKLQTEILHFHPHKKLRKSIFMADKKNGMTLSTRPLSVLSLKALWGPSLEREEEKGLSISVSFLWQSDQQVSSILHWWRAFEFFNATHFSSFFLWVNWGCTEEALVFERGRHFNPILALELHSFLVDRED
jgi:hypothetical protein